MPAIRQRTVALPRGESQPGAELVGGTSQAGERSPIAEAPPKCARRGFSSRTSHGEVCGSGVPVPEIRFRSSSTAGSGDTRRGGFMQRFLTFVVLLLLTVPVGLSIQGCANKNSDYCNGVGYGYNNDPTSLDLVAAADDGLIGCVLANLATASSLGAELQGRLSVGGHLYLRHHRPDHRRRFAHGRDVRRHLESPYPRGRRLHHLPPHQQDRASRI